MRALLDAMGREMPFNLSDWKRIITVSDGEGSGSVAVALWDLSRPGSTPLITRADVPESWKARGSRDGAWGSIIAEGEGVGPLRALATWPHLLQRAL